MKGGHPSTLCLLPRPGSCAIWTLISLALVTPSWESGVASLPVAFAFCCLAGHSSSMVDLHSSPGGREAGPHLHGHQRGSEC